MAKEHKKAGRPSKRSDELIDHICDKIAEGESLRSICSADDMPDFSTVVRWLGKDDDFATKYARAREIQSHVFVDKMLEKAESLPDVNPQTGALDSASVAHIRNQVATLQWLAMKLNPKKYGDKVDVNHGGGVAITVSTGIPDGESQH
jgi:hypothetical protein